MKQFMLQMLQSIVTVIVISTMAVMIFRFKVFDALIIPHSSLFDK